MTAPAHPPADRSRAIVVRLAGVVAAVVAGLWLHTALAERLAAIAVRADDDVVAARHDLALLIRLVFVPALALTTAIGVAIGSASRHAFRESRFPATGSRFAHRGGRVLTGAPARRAARIGLGLGVALSLCSLAAAGLLWWITRVLLLCRA